MSMGREQTYDDFVSTRSALLLKSAFMLTGDRDQAEDLVQTALLRAFIAWHRVAAAEDPYAYVRRILFTSFARTKRRRAPVVYRPSEQVPSHAEAVEDRDQLRRALSALTPRQRAVVVLRFYEDLGVDQVAHLLRISPGTVKSQTSKALAHLRISVELDVEEAR